MQTPENTPSDDHRGSLGQLVRWMGAVQGVGFRALVRNEARRRGLAGWVRNRNDGSVEAMLIGDAVAISELVEVIAQTRQGAIRETAARSLDRSYLRCEGPFFVAPTSGVDAFLPYNGGGHG